jgi:pimeloyl-ACP methyl ester carboxylesterase
VISTPNEARGYAELQAKLLALSRNSEHVIAWNSTHMVPIDEPEVITKAIQEVALQARRERKDQP